jgi:hypothetical protein
MQGAKHGMLLSPHVDSEHGNQPWCFQVSQLMQEASLGSRQEGQGYDLGQAAVRATNNIVNLSNNATSAW